MSAEIEFEGLDELTAKIASMVDDEKIYKALGKCCALVERAAKEKAPKKGGELRRSITSKVEDGVGIVFTPLFYAPYVEFGTGLFAEGGNGRKEVPWVYVEGGGGAPGGSKKTVYNSAEEAMAAVIYLKEEKGLDAVMTYGEKPQPFMRPALNENRENIKRILKKEVLQDD